MSAKKENATIVGLGVTACAACCAGPILGMLAAIGLGTAAGFALIGLLAIAVGAAAMALVAIRRRRRAMPCSTSESSPSGAGRVVAPAPTAMTLADLTSVRSLLGAAHLGR